MQSHTAHPSSPQCGWGSLFFLSAHPSDRPHLRLCLLKGFKGDRIRHLATDYYLAFKRLNFRCDHPKRAHNNHHHKREHKQSQDVLARVLLVADDKCVCPYEKKHNSELLCCCFIPFPQDDFINYDCRSWSYGARRMITAAGHTTHRRSFELNKLNF